MSFALDSSDIHIRPATPEDAEAIAILSDQLGYPVATIAVEQRLHQILSNNSHIIYVASGSDNRAIAWIHAYACHLLLTDFQAEIGGLVVAQSDRGTGIGRKKFCHVAIRKDGFTQNLRFYKDLGRPTWTGIGKFYNSRFSCLHACDSQSPYYGDNQNRDNYHPQNERQQNLPLISNLSLYPV